jgi:hypothetical protein
MRNYAIFVVLHRACQNKDSRSLLTSRTSNKVCHFFLVRKEDIDLIIERRAVHGRNTPNAKHQDTENSIIYNYSMKVVSL